MPCLSAFEKELATKEPERTVGLALKVKFTEEGADFEALIENGMTFRASYPFEKPAVVAENQDRMLRMICGQLGKTSGAFSFSVADVSSDGPLPLMSAGTLNGFRRSLAEKAHAALGGSAALAAPTASADSAALAHPRRDGELMRSRYCILHELGKCLKTPSGRAFAKNGLLLKNNGKLIPLHFDCKNCEMVLRLQK